MLLPLCLPAATDDLTGALQRGLFEEEANRNLDAAAQAYQAVSAQFDKDRKLAATAIFRLGEVYRKQGRTNEAVAQYERIVREFAEEQTLATLSRQNLAGLGAKQATTSAAEPDQSASIPLTPEAEELARTEKILLQLKDWDLPQLRRLIPKLAPDAEFERLETELATIEIRGSAVPEDLLKRREEVKALMEARAAVILKTLDLRAQSLRVVVSKQLAANKTVSPSGEDKKSIPVSTDDEEKEIRRIQEIIRNSPDLVNAPSGDPSMTPLCRAARNGHLRVAKFLLDGSAAIDRRSSGSTPLHYAVSAGHRAMTDFLLERGADVSARDGNGRTPLHIAAENGFQLVAEGLVARKADINAVTSKQETPLHLAAGKGHAELTKFLISKGAEPDAKDDSNRTALSLAAARGHSESVTVLLEAKANPNLEDKQGRTPLSYAAEASHLHSVKPLLEAKADPNAGRLSLPLHAAIHRKSPAVIEALLRAGADANRSAAIGWTFQVSNQGYGPQWGYNILTPLFLAINESKSPEAVRLLLQHKADPNAVGPNGEPLVFSAVHQPEILKLLLEAGAKPNVERKDSTGYTPIHAAALAESVKLLLTHGANPEIRVQDQTPLLAAVPGRNKSKVEALLQGGADVNAKNNYDSTPLHLAVMNRDSEIVSLLLAHKADVNARDRDGQTPLDYVKDDKQNANIAELLRQHGGLSDLPKLDRIVVKHPGTSFSTWLFLKGTNDWNRFMLLDALFGLYGPKDTPAPPARVGGGAPSFTDRIAAIQASGPQKDLPFPDLHRVVVVRSGAAPTKTPERINVDLLLPTGAVDCTKDIPLEFGDVVEILEREHTLQELAVGLTAEELQQIAKCREGKMGLLVRGKRTDLQVLPSRGSALIGNLLARQEVRGALFSSSDLSRLKLVRRDPASGKQREWIVDCSGGQFPDLWLRDGDVIEVPDKP